MRSSRAHRIASLIAIMLLALANAGCPELNRQPDYMGKQQVSTDRASPEVAAAQPGTTARQVFDHGNIMVSN